MQGGEIVSLSKDGNDLGMRVSHPLLAGRRDAGFSEFILLFKNSTRHYFQAVAHSSALIYDLKEIVRLEPIIAGIEQTEPGSVKLKCAWGGDSAPEGRLFIAASDLRIFDEAFDPLEAKDLLALKG